ncbi:MAG: hypothetical protein NT093_02115 [Candidatus Moranbacteria bacterium]|nr:hypothetical protein [Candidatus Moranbacteria bacterium]
MPARDGFAFGGKTKIITAILVLAFSISGQAFASTSAWSDVSGSGGKKGIISVKRGLEPDIKVSQEGKVYAAFQEGSKNRARVREFDGQRWLDLSDQSDPQGMISAKKGANPILETKGNEVYAAFSDWTNGKRVRVKKWNGSAWTDLSDANHPSGLVSNLQGSEPILAFDKDREYLYVGFRDDANGSRARIMRWKDGLGWQNVSDQNYPEGLISDGMGLEVDMVAAKNSNSMFAVFEDMNRGGAVRVKKWNGISWTDVSDASHTDGIVGSQAGFSPSLAVSGNGSLFLVYHGKNEKNTYAYQWNGAAWSVLGSEIVIRGGTSESRAAADERNNLYIAYSYKSKGKWNVAAKIWNGAAWIDSKAGKSQNISKGKGNPALSVFDNRLYMCVAEGKAKARVKMLNFEP